MRKLLLSFLTVLILMAASITVKAQDYDRAIGAALGTAMGLSYKQAVGNQRMVEVTVGGSFRPKGFYMDAFYDFYFDLPGVTKNLSLYAGPGLNLGTWGHKNGDIHRFTMGVSFNLGLDYHIPGSQFDISADWRPAIQFVGHSNVWRGNIATVGIRRTF